MSVAVGYACTTCRQTVSLAVDESCAVCRGPVFLVGSKWRAPRKSNGTAWARVTAGELLWDRRAVIRSEHRRAVKLAALTVRAKAARRTRLAASVRLRPLRRNRNAPHI